MTFTRAPELSLGVLQKILSLHEHVRLRGKEKETLRLSISNVKQKH